MDLPEGFASYSLLNGADICGEGTGHFRLSGKQKLKSNWSEQKKNCVELLPLYLRPMII